MDDLYRVDYSTNGSVWTEFCTESYVNMLVFDELRVDYIPADTIIIRCFKPLDVKPVKICSQCDLEIGSIDCGELVSNGVCNG
jgi:hypothetical protein